MRNFHLGWTSPLRAVLFNKVLQLIHKKRADFDNTQSPMVLSLSVSLNSRNRQHPVDSAYVLTRPPRSEMKRCCSIWSEGEVKTCVHLDRLSNTCWLQRGCCAHLPQIRLQLNTLKSTYKVFTVIKHKHTYGISPVCILERLYFFPQFVVLWSIVLNSEEERERVCVCYCTRSQWQIEINI